MAPPQACNSRILEIKLISAQDLAPVSKSMKTYAVSWVSPERKLTTRVDESNQRNPVWNDKLVFRIDDKFIYDEESTIMIEIYATAWTKDVLIGTVIVFLGDIFPRSSDNNKSSAMRFVSLQVLRPSGRPQGMLNIGIALLDSTLRSMPMFTDPATTGAKSTEKIKPEQAKLRRVNSDQTDLTSSDVYFYPPVPNNAESACNESSCLFKGGIYDSSACNESIVTPKGHNGINGSILNGSLISDVGPSASIVATAIAKGLYYNQPKTKNRNREDTGSLILEDTEEGAKDKLDRWRAESMYEHSRKHSKAASVNGDSKLSELDDKKSNKKGGRRQKKGGGLFSCVGNVFGCEISISCGGDNDEDGKKKKKNAKSNKVVNLSSLDGATYNSYA